MSMTPVPVCWQTTVTAENEKESCSTGFSACGGSRKRHSTIPPQCDPRGAFLSYGNEDSHTIKKTPAHAEVFYPVLLITEFLRSAHSVVSI